MGLSSLINTTLKFIKQKYPLVGIPVIIQNSKKEILLGKRSKKSPFYPDYWGLPGGLVEYNEKIKDTAKRELEEELGIKIKLIRQAKAQNVLPNKKCSIHAVDVPFYAKIINGKPKANDETSKVKWFKPSEIKKMNLAYEHKNLLKKEGLI